MEQEIIIQKIFIMIKNDFDKKSYTNYERVIDKINDVTKSLTNYEPVIIKELIIYIEKVFKILFVPEESSNFVKTINSTTQDLKLDWHEEHEFVEAKHVKKICVINGGDTLSRGVTIKNLAVSVYTRNSKITFGDTALQMNRWFGHKFKYVDLAPYFQVMLERDLPDGDQKHKYVRTAWFTYTNIKDLPSFEIEFIRGNISDFEYKFRKDLFNDLTLHNANILTIL